jgi:hypothetical protein
VSAPEDMGVRVYVFRDRPCVIAAAVGRALGYADGGRSLTERVRGEWADEMIRARDFAVLEGDDLREFKALPALSTEGVVSPNTRSLAVLYESGWDLVCIKTEKPEGVCLRRCFSAREEWPTSARQKWSTRGWPTPAWIEARRTFVAQEPAWLQARLDAPALSPPLPRSSPRAQGTSTGPSACSRDPSSRGTSWEVP